MANTITSSLNATCSSFSAFASWGSFINGCLINSKCNMVQTNDKIQMVWNTISKTLSSITGNGTIWTGTTSTAHTFRQGQIVSISGTTHFNGDFVLASASGTTFTITNATQNGVTDTGSFTAAINAYTYTGDFLPANAATLNGLANTSLVSKVHSDVIWNSGTTYAVGDVIWFNDGSGHFSTFISVSAANLNNTPNAVTVGSTGNSTGGTKWKVWLYELYSTNDGLTNAYMRLEYGTVSANVAQVALQWGNTDSGTADLYASGNCTNRELVGGQGSPSASATTFDCNFCGYGDGSGFVVCMWRAATTTISSLFFGFERSRDNTGVNTNSFITYVINNQGAANGTGSTNNMFKQCTLFLSGAQAIGRRDFHINTIGEVHANDVAAPGASANSWQVGNNIPAAPVFPNAGYWANPMLMLTAINNIDGTDGTTFSITMYAASHTFLILKGVTSGGIYFQCASNRASLVSTAALLPCMRWE